MKIVGSVWFSLRSVMSTTGIIGVVLIQTVRDRKCKAYIGIGAGEHQEDDEKFIALHGTPFPVEPAKEMIAPNQNGTCGWEVSK